MADLDHAKLKALADGHLTDLRTACETAFAGQGDFAFCTAMIAVWSFLLETYEPADHRVEPVAAARGLARRCVGGRRQVWHQDQFCCSLEAQRGPKIDAIGLFDAGERVGWRLPKECPVFAREPTKLPEPISHGDLGHGRIGRGALVQRAPHHMHPAQQQVVLGRHS